MIGQVIDVASDNVHLSVNRGFVQLHREKKKLGEIAFDDISAILVHGHGCSFSTNLCERLAERNILLVICGSNHVPVSLVTPLSGNFEQGKRMQAQSEASRPLKKRLWQQIVIAKINAQADALDLIGNSQPGIREMGKRVKSGDPDNLEAQSARRYWVAMMGEGFRRDRNSSGINLLLNYGYAVLRASVSRSILAAGLHPSLSVHHVSRGDSFRLADDLMEPFRPWVDHTARKIVETQGDELNSDSKLQLVRILSLDLSCDRGVSPMQVCIDKLAVSLAQVYLGERQKLEFSGAPIPFNN